MHSHVPGSVATNYNVSVIKISIYPKVILRERNEDCEAVAARILLRLIGGLNVTRTNGYEEDKLKPARGSAWGPNSK